MLLVNEYRSLTLRVVKLERLWDLSNPQLQVQSRVPGKAKPSRQGPEVEAVGFQFSEAD